MLEEEGVGVGKKTNKKKTRETEEDGDEKRVKRKRRGEQRVVYSLPSTSPLTLMRRQIAIVI